MGTLHKAGLIRLSDAVKVGSDLDLVARHLHFSHRQRNPLYILLASIVLNRLEEDFKLPS